ncbi:MAG: hypothetical protein DMF80_01870 [Acidobacteria bacterium]|nr:MAG: hypothetical protein DMF80_01870 [Acidobacteriota bacterium]
MKLGNATAVLLLGASASLLATGAEAAHPAAGDPALQMIAPGPGAGEVRMALGGAARRLARPACARVFADFADASGRPLQERLDRLGLTGAGYLALVFFAEGLDRGRCQQDQVLATATPGRRVVSVCGRFARAYLHDPRWAELTLIHEALHTLGLGEDPPSTFDISARVAGRCGR